MISSMSTAASEIDTKAVPVTIRNVTSWRCAKCRKPVDETKSLWFATGKGRSRVWHPGCR
jgi:hypothetical protein